MSFAFELVLFATLEPLGNEVDEGLGVETLRQWMTLEDVEQDAIYKVATHIRAKPLLPPQLDEYKGEDVDSMSGVVFPTIHCAIRGCTWCSATQPCAPNYQKNQMWILKDLKWTHPDKTCCSDASCCLWAHLQSSHAQVFADFDRTDIPSTYLAALFVKEDATVPQVGWSIDRRTFRRMSQELQEHNLVGLCCACCTRTHVGATNGEIGYVRVQDHFSNLTVQSYKANWCYESYQRNYGAHPAIKKRLAEKEWARHVPGHGQILCCPEDIRCKQCPSGAQTLCHACELPICRSCLTRMTQQSYNAVPQALTNDNWVGYPTELLYQHQVRWIEAAAACPVWTSMVCYYLEADRGHLMDEDIHRADHRIAVRGNVSSFSMPWEEILATLDPTRDGHKTWGTLPHSKDTLRALVKISVKGMRHNEAIQWVSGAKIRPWVVTALLHHLIDLQHPMCTAIDSPDMAKEKVSERVTLAYGTEETEPLVDTPPDAAQPSIADRVAERTQPFVNNPKHAAQSSQTPLKHATPELSAETSLTGEAFTGSLRPNILSQDYAGAQVHDAESGLVTSLASTTDNMTIETGHSFWGQWKNDFVYWAFPFSLPAPTGGPDFPQKPRPRRLADAPTFTPLAHLKHLTGRIESSIRNSWDLVPGMRRITGKWDSVWGGNLWRKWHMNRKSIETVPVAEWVQAAQGLYKKLQKGKYISADGRERPIQYDTRKLYYAKGLTKPEHQLLQDVRSMQTTVPGTIEARRRIGRFLFGARVELGEPVFITISPTTRHNALCLKLSRYRVADPGRGPCSSMTSPPLWEAASVEVDTPGYDVRREVTARDPWAVVLSFQTIVRLIFAQVLGIRMCFRCPDCDCRDANGHASHPVGGILGLVRGLCGAIEYQSNSTPHFHCNVFLASIWQQPLHVLLAKIKQKEITFEEICRFQTWLHNETHPKPEQHAAHVKTLEQEWKENFCQSKHNQLCHWPKFLQADRAPCPWLTQTFRADVKQDAKAYVASYAAAVQTKFSTQQYHWHPWDPKQKCRLPLAGCKKKGAPNKCKHGFPKPLNWLVRVVCRGNARKHQQSTRGRRNGLGLLLGKRDDPWLSGTMNAFTVLLFGNSHTGVNFRVPLCEETHDKDCTRNCLEHSTLQKLQRTMQQAARRATRYFTGYLQKPQPIGKKELEQAAKQLHYLHTTETQDPDGQHYRKVATRVFGDLEFRCSVRPITEEFMLAGFGYASEPTAAECIRSFPVVPFVGCEWLTWLDGVSEVRHKVDPHNFRHSNLKLSEVYGWRGKDIRVYYLSPWEFVKWWSLKKLQPPGDTVSKQQKAFSVWVPGIDPSKPPPDGWKYGRDFVWKKKIPASAGPHILRLPASFQAAAAAGHYLERHTEPLVPFPTVCPLPKPDMSKDAQARLFNVYLRPWTLDAHDASLHVPHIDALDLPFASRAPDRPVTHRVQGKTTPGIRGHYAAWKEYLHKHIASEHAKNMIQNFLAAAECTPEETDPVDQPFKHERSDVDTSWIDVNTIEKLTQGVGFEYSKRSGPAVQQILQTWNLDRPATDQTWTLPDSRPEVPPSQQDTTPNVPKDIKKPENLKWTYGTLTDQKASEWLQSLIEHDKHVKPTEEQINFLRAVVQRCVAEGHEEVTDTPARSEPWRTIFHGVPGAGKTQTLKWLRQFFETICEWKHPQEFVFLAPQNTQAALIAGMTLHSFANIRINSKHTSKTTTQGPEQFVQYQRLRWMVLDECSTTGLEVLATLEKRLTQATRAKGTWKLNAKGVARPFGGLNLIITGDMWQFPPVKATAMFQNPFLKTSSFQVQALQKFFWSHDTSGIAHLFELTKEQRCCDPWLSYVLKQARHGTMSHEVYCYLHGFPTVHPGSWNFVTQTCECQNPTCATLAHTWTDSRNNSKGTQTWEDRVALECVACRAERSRRCWVGRDQKGTKFLTQPFVHGLNAAKYVAANLRARWAAAIKQQTLLWVIAEDTPLFQLDTDNIDEYHARRENWLQRHDQSTGGLVGLFPLLQDMPIRITQTLPELKPFGLFKNTRGRLVSWTLNPIDQARVNEDLGPNVVLAALPQALYVKIPGATWKQHATLPPGIACIRPTVQHWQLEAKGRATIARRGFPIASDFSGTAHSFMGATLQACTLDLGVWDATPSREAQLSGYMCISRVKRSEDICITQPFSPNLFTNGDLIGPETLLAFHRGNITLPEAEKKFSKDAPKKKRNPDIMLYCRGCSPNGSRPDKLLPLREFVTKWDPDEWFVILSEGMDRLCKHCVDKLGSPRQLPSSKATDPCAFCNNLPATPSGFCSICDEDVRIACAKCDKGKKLRTKKLIDFTPDEIRRRKKTKEMRKACCRKCAAKTQTATSRQWRVHTVR